MTEDEAASGIGCAVTLVGLFCWVSDVLWAAHKGVMALALVVIVPPFGIVAGLLHLMGKL